MSCRDVAFLLFVVAASVMAADPHEHLKLNESAGTSAIDSSGNNFHGTLVGGSQFDTGGRLRNAVLTDGTNGYVRLANDPTLSFADNEVFTIALWVKTTDAYGPIASFRNSADDDSLIDICVGLNGVTNNPGQLVVIVRRDAGGGTPEVNGPIINDNNWHHVALVRTATQLELFVDGTSRSTNNSAVGLGALTFDERALGAELRWIAVNVNTADQRFLNGRVDDFRLYKRAISAAEVLDLATPDTATALSASPAPSTFGLSTTLTATVTNTRTAPNAGSVTFFDGSTNVGSSNLNSSGVATLNVGSLSGGAHTFSAVYGGESLWAASTSANLAHTVNPAATTTTLTPPASTSFGVNATFTAGVSSSAAGTLTGTVTLNLGATPLVSAPLVGGQATLTIGSLVAGTNVLTATYSGDANFATSTSANTNFAVTQAATTTALTLPAATVFGEPALYSIAVASTGGVPTGTVTLFEGSTSLGSATLTGGLATVNSSVLTAGTHTLHATYAASANFSASTSANTNFTVNPAPTQTTLLSAQNPARLGVPITITAQIATLAPGSGTANAGSVIFSVDGVATATVGVVNGSGAVTLTLAGGDHAVSALYQGAPNFAPSVSTVLTQSSQIPPVADAQTVVVPQNRNCLFVLTGSDSGNLPLTYSVLSAPAHGTLSGTAPNLTYTPAADFTGTDTFTFSVHNSQQQSVPATITLNTIAAPVFASTLAFSPNPAVAGQPVSGSAGIMAEDGAALVWNWGDGSTDSDSSHVFAQAGIYTITVTATGKGTGLTSTTTTTLYVSVGLEGASSGGAATPGVVGILVGGDGVGISGGGKGKIVCNYVRRDKTTYSGALGTLAFPAGLQQSDLLATNGILTLGTGAKAQQFYFTLDAKGKSKSTDLPKIELSLKKKLFEFKAKRAALADLTESLGGPREFEISAGQTVTLMVPATVQIGTKLFLAMTFQVGYHQINSKGGKGSLE